MSGHPAPFSKPHLEAIAAYLSPTMRRHRGDFRYVLDPFAGAGGIHKLRPQFVTIGVEIEPVFIEQGPPWTIQGDATILPFPDEMFDAVATSPTWGNRMADKHEAKDDSKRITYTHMLGAPLAARNTGRMQWGDEYRELHLEAWREAYRVIRPGGRFILHIADHVRGGDVQPVSAFHMEAAVEAGFRRRHTTVLDKKGMGFGANREVRVGFEWIVHFARP